MTRKIILLAALGGLCLAAPLAQAHEPSGFGVHFGFGAGGGHVRGHFGRRWAAPVRVAAPVHVHTRTPIYRQVWVPARYDTVFAGYDHCGRPIYRNVCVSAGHYESVFAGYRGCSCGH